MLGHVLTCKQRQAFADMSGCTGTHSCTSTRPLRCRHLGATTLLSRSRNQPRLNHCKRLTLRADASSQQGLIHAATLASWMAVISAAASPRHATGDSSQEEATPAVTEGRAALATLNANGVQPPGQLEELDQTPSALQQWMYPGLIRAPCLSHPTHA